MPSKVHLTLFASGGGTNAQALLDYFRGHATVRINLVVTNNPQAGVVGRALRACVPVEIIGKDGWQRQPERLVALLRRHRTQAIALAGYLKMIPPEVVQAYAGRMVNIHPSLLPRHGGPGMYGLRVHEAVLAAADAETGCTVHLVTAEYDQGAILAQARLPVPPGCTAQQLQAAVLHHEHTLYPPAVEQWCNSWHAADKSRT